MTTNLPFETLGIASDETARVTDFVASWEQHGGPLLFVGSGMSRHQALRKAGVPEKVEIQDWSQLTAHLRTATSGDDLGVDGTSIDHPGVAQTYEDMSGRRRLMDNIERAIPYKEFTPGPAHRALCDFKWASVLTTNYDDFLERAFGEAGRNFCKIVNDDDLTRGRRPDSLEIIKMHGCLEAPGSVILSAEDFRTYDERRPAMTSRIRSLFHNHPTLFLGCSMTDPNVTQMFEWVARRSGEWGLVSIALMHRAPSPEEKRAWADRKVHLVLLPSERTVVDFLRSLRDAWRRGMSPNAQNPSSPSIGRDISAALDARGEGWTASVRALVTDAFNGSSDRDRKDVVYRLLGGLHTLSREDVDGVLRSLDAVVRRRFLLEALRSGIVESGRLGLNIESVLLADVQLSSDQRCELLVLRAERHGRRGETEPAKAALQEAMTLRTEEAWKPAVQGRLRRLLHRLGDESLIKSALLAPADADDAYGYARRGADLLMTEDRAAARVWYEEARRLARNADEKTAALWGLQACEVPGEWKSLSEYEPDWQAIQDSERPRLKSVLELKAEAGAELLRSYREGARSHGTEASLALGHILEAIEAGDDMGWPRSQNPNFTGPLDSLAYAAVGLLTRQGADIADIRQGLSLFVERGLLQAHRRLHVGEVDRLLALAQVEWTRAFLTPRDEARYMRRSRDLLASALIPALKDEEIEAHLERVLDPEDLEKEDVRHTAPTTLHLDLLQRHYHCLPARAARQLVALVARLFASREFASWRYASWTCLPVYDWTKTGTLDRGSREVRQLITALVAFFEKAEGANWLDNNRALHLLDELRDANALETTDRTAIVLALDRAVEQRVRAGADPAGVLGLVRARQELEAGAPPSLVLERFCAMYAALRNSTAAGTWLNLLDVVGRHLPEAGKVEAAAFIEDYLQLTLSNDGDGLLGPFPDWAATAIHQGVKGGLVTREAGKQLLQRLTNAYPDCIVFALGMPGVEFAVAQSELHAGLARGRADWDTVLRWCRWLPSGSPQDRDLECILLGLLRSPAAEDRQRAFWSLRWLARHASLSDETKRSTCKFIREHGAQDPDWKPRAAAVVALAELTTALDLEDLRSLLASAEQDPVAGVRRAAGLLRLACGARPPPEDLQPHG